MIKTASINGAFYKNAVTEKDAVMRKARRSDEAAGKRGKT